MAAIPNITGGPSGPATASLSAAGGTSTNDWGGLNLVKFDTGPFFVVGAVVVLIVFLVLAKKKR